MSLLLEGICLYYRLFVIVDSDKRTKVIKSGGECISSCIINLSAHSHAILSIACDSHIGGFVHNKESVGMTILFLL